MKEPQTLWPTVLLFLACSQHTACLQTLLIGGLFDIDTSRGGWNSAGIIPAVQMAFDDINNRSDILDGYRLELVIKDSKVEFESALLSCLFSLQFSVSMHYTYI